MLKNKILPLSVVISIIAAETIAPTYVSAAGHVSEITFQNGQTIHSLGPEALKQALLKTGSNMLIMDLYALTILKQENIEFKSVGTLYSLQKDKITQHQVKAKENAKLWLDILKGQIHTINQNIITYDSRFQSYYNTLIKAIQNEEKDTVITGVSNLYGEINKYGQELSVVLDNLKKYKTRLSQDTHYFRDDAENVKSTLTHNNNNIPLLNKKIQECQAKLNTYYKLGITGIVTTCIGTMTTAGGIAVMISGAGIPIGAGLLGGGVILLSAGGTMAKSFQEKYDEVESEMYTMLQTKNRMEKDFIHLVEIQNKVIYLADTIDIAIQAVQAISDQWNSIGLKYGNLLQEIQYMNAADLYIIKKHLEMAKEDWTEVKTVAKNIQTSKIQYK